MNAAERIASKIRPMIAAKKPFASLERLIKKSEEILESESHYPRQRTFRFEDGSQLDLNFFTSRRSLTVSAWN